MGHLRNSRKSKAPLNEKRVEWAIRGTAASQKAPLNEKRVEWATRPAGSVPHIRQRKADVGHLFTC
jgi:hypothetical protein